MSKLIEDKKTLIHIATEFVVLAGMAFHFTNKNNALKKILEELCNKVEQQQDTITKLEQNLNNINNVIQNRILPELLTKTKQKKQKETKTRKEIQQTKPPLERQECKRVIVISRQKTPLKEEEEEEKKIELVEEEDEEEVVEEVVDSDEQEVEIGGDDGVNCSSTDLDAELHEELQELREEEE
jgi:sugar-specific transcriptional regulator TrmB